MSHRGINQWPPVSEELRQLPFLLLSKNLSVASLSCKRLHTDLNGHNQLPPEILPLMGILLYDSFCPFSQTQTLHRTGDSSPPLPLLISSGRAIRAACTKLCLAFCSTLPTIHKICCPEPLKAWYTQQPQQHDQARLQATALLWVLRHKLYPGLAPTLSNKAASGRTVQLKIQKLKLAMNLSK